MFVDRTLAFGSRRSLFGTLTIPGSARSLRPLLPATLGTLVEPSEKDNLYSVDATEHLPVALLVGTIGRALPQNRPGPHRFYK